MADTQTPITKMPMSWADKVGIDLRSLMSPKANDPNGGALGVIRVVVPDAATGDVIVGPIPVQFRVAEVTVVKQVANGGAANTIQVFNDPPGGGSAAITNAMSINVNDQTVVRVGTLDDAVWDILPGSNVKVTRTKVGGNAACLVQIFGYRT